MNAKNNVLNATYVEQYFIDHTEPHTGEEMDKLRAEYNEFCTELETILAQKMQPEQFNRIKTLLRIFLGTKKQIEAGLVNIIVAHPYLVLMPYVTLNFFRFRTICINLIKKMIQGKQSLNKLCC